MHFRFAFLVSEAASPRPGHGIIKPGVTEPHHPFAQGLRRLRPSLGLDRHASARARDGLINLRPLHSLPHFRYKDYAGCVRSFRRPQTVETVRLTSGASQSCQRPRDYVRPRPTLARDATHGQDTALRREAAPVAEDSSNSPRDFVRPRHQQ